MRKFLTIIALLLSTAAFAADEPDANNLLDTLASVQSAREAHAIERQLDKIWAHSGSASVDLLLERAKSAYDDGDLETASDLLKRVTSIAPDFAEAWNRRAEVSAEKEDYDDTMSSLRRVLAIEPRQYTALVGLGSVLEEFGDKTHALEAYRKALAINPFIDGVSDRIRELRRDLGGRDI